MSRKKLVGTWKLISWKIKSNDAVIYPFGQNAIGYIMYNEDGYMSAAVMTADRSQFTSSLIWAVNQRWEELFVEGRTI